jgi:hypothetical protein
MREDHVAGRSPRSKPAREDQRHHSVEHSPPPDGPTYITDAELVARIDRVSDLDRRWFERHPRRAYRIRRMVDGEHLDLVCPPGKLALTLVKQVRPGFRTRAPLWAVRWPCSCDECLAEIWELCTPSSFRDTLVSAAAAMMREHRA